MFKSIAIFLKLTATYSLHYVGKHLEALTHAVNFKIKSDYPDTSSQAATI